MSDRCTGAFIHIGDIVVEEESEESAYFDNLRIANMPVTKGWVATFEGVVTLVNGEDGFMATIIRRGNTPQEAVDQIQTLVESFGWRVALN